MILRLVLSSEVRNAAAMRKHVRRILAAQRDILAPSPSRTSSGRWRI